MTERLSWSELRRAIPPLPLRVTGSGRVHLSIANDDGRPRRTITLLMRPLDAVALHTEAETLHQLIAIGEPANDNERKEPS
jgi:hypothetical protein